MSRASRNPISLLLLRLAQQHMLCLLQEAPTAVAEYWRAVCGGLGEWACQCCSWMSSCRSGGVGSVNKSVFGVLYLRPVQPASAFCGHHLGGILGTSKRRCSYCSAQWIHAAEIWHRKRDLVVLFGKGGLLLSIFEWSLISFTGCGLFLPCCGILRLGISNYAKNHYQHHEYLTTNSFVFRK